MQNFCTLEQAKRLKAAGFPQGKSQMMYCKDQQCITSQMDNNFCKKEHWDAPSAAEIMEEISDINVIHTGGAWHVSCGAGQAWVINSDLLAALVEAFVKSRGK